MNILQPDRLSDEVTCPYIPGNRCRYRYFFATDVTADELEHLLATGWRKFGPYYFMPECGECRECVPVRVLAREFAPSANQRKTLAKARAIETRFEPLAFSEEIFDIYCDHSINRFGSNPSLDDFLHNFYYPSCPALQSEYRLGDSLIAAGFIDQSSRGLSSVYFIYRTAHGRYSLGTVSAIREIEHARELGLDYYYLGYHVARNHFMAYKNRFRPYQRFDWEKKQWAQPEE
ncbi:MAG TPA: hypothetical protein PKJ16_10040 [Spirochaetota bacterium]|nr:hypothetical protein [Spirochaetota bacterium]HOS39790.1 hypothetical protein [Spirochaetota bacterium]HPU88609.1 hypothetical protein [Spirochaetota bacterium]